MCLCVLILGGLVGLHTVNFSFFGISGQGIDLDSCEVEWFALETALVNTWATMNLCRDGVIV